MRVMVGAGARTIGERVILDDSEAHHLKVRRVVDGERVDVGNGQGGMGRGTVSRNGDGWIVELDEWTIFPRRCDVILAVGAGDRDRFLWLAEKCTELGVARLIPLVTEYSRQVETQLRDGALDKARRRASEAAKQSGNPWTTIIDPLTAVSDLEGGDLGEVTWLLADAAGIPPNRVPQANPLGWIIGPEGGFSPAEGLALRQRLNAMPVALGPFVMRFETAAVVAAGLAAAASIEPKE